MSNIDKQSDLSAANLEKYLGHPLDNRSGVCFERSLELDESEQFPKKEADILESWGLNQFYVPHNFGGKLESYEELLHLVRAVSRRDLTLMIGHGKTLLGTTPTWLAGSKQQCQELAHRVLSGQSISLALTEESHGSDLLASEVSTTYDQDGTIRLNGRKWLINNGTRSDCITVFARSDPDGGPRGFTLFLVRKDELKSQFEHTPKIQTHGIRGADISGIRFKNARIDSSSQLGELGSGLELTLRLLQVTRTLCAGLSIGALDSALRHAYQFATSRQLYGRRALQIPAVKSRLIGAYLDLLTCECVAICATRSLHTMPEQASLHSSIVKYLVPSLADSAIRSLSVVIGARFFLRENQYGGLFQKIIRDHSLVGLFDGSSEVNLDAISNQLLLVTRKTKASDKEVAASVLGNTFRLAQPVNTFDPARIVLANRGLDSVTNSLDSATISRLKSEYGDETARLAASVNDRLDVIAGDVVSVRSLLPMRGARSEPMFRLSKQYSLLYAAAACLNIAAYSRNNLSAHDDSGWLTLCIERLLLATQNSSSGGVSNSITDAELSAVFEKQWRNNMSFSLRDMDLG